MCTVRLALMALALAQVVSADEPNQAQPTKIGDIKRLCVVPVFTGDEQSAGLARESAMAALFSLKRFTVTENCDNADAFLKGAVTERSGERTRAEGEGVGFGRAAGAARADRSSAAAAVGAVSGSNSEGLYSSETRFQAAVVLRITNRAGDVIWAHTQDSQGGKVRGAVTDAIERAVRQLARDLDRKVPAS